MQICGISAEPLDLLADTNAGPRTTLADSTVFRIRNPAELGLGFESESTLENLVKGRRRMITHEQKQAAADALAEALWGTRMPTKPPRSATSPMSGLQSGATAREFITRSAKQHAVDALRAMERH